MTRPRRLLLLALAASLLLLPGCAGAPRSRTLAGTWTRLDPVPSPGPRVSPLSWSEPSGTLWLFGGEGPQGFLSDLWKFDGKGWTLVKGTADPEAPPVYGARGVPAPGNLPPARVRAATWRDAEGRLWWYGGFGKDATGCLSVFGDLWFYNGADFVWAGGSQTPNLDPAYGPLGEASPASDPGARSRSGSWVDQEGKPWLYGGANRGDLWSFDGSQWAWEGGSAEWEPGWACKGETTPSPGDFPGARNAPATWTDGAGNLFLFGGEGWDDKCAVTIRSDLWRVSLATRAWSLLQPDQKPGQAASAGRPGPRWYAAVAPDGKGGAWLFGGDSSAGWDEGGSQLLEDLWQATGDGWKRWEGPDGAPRPSPRRGALAWTGQGGELYLFGGEGKAPPAGEKVGGKGFLGDLWVFHPARP